VTIAATLVFAAVDAHAYIGPGAGFALISSFLTLLIAFSTAFFALLTFPVRAIIRSIKRRRSLAKSKVKKVIILGLDGLEPTITERMIEQGELPNMKKLMDSGAYRRLGTSTPALSPVAWSTFATGTDSSGHAIFDFLSRDRRTYLPKISSSEVYGDSRFLKLGPFRIPLSSGGVRMLRKSKTFWRLLSEHGVFCSVLRVPITFPVEKINGVMVAAMCVPDLRGSQGSFTFWTSSEAADKYGGLVIKLQNGAGPIPTSIPGPASPVNGSTLELPMTITPDKERGGIEVVLPDQTFFVKLHEYTPWIKLTYKAAAGMKLTGIARFYVTELGDDFGLYMTPIHIDPEKPAMPITHPSVFSIYLSKLLGPYGTLGLAEDTWALNERVIDEKAWLEQAYGLHAEREAMWFHSLDRLRDGMVVCVFDISDRLQHMFFRYLEEDHPANAGKDTTVYKDALYDMYRKMDDLVGRTMKYVDDKTALIVLSDHGFKPYRRGVDVNTWLVREGLMHLKDGATEGGEYLSNVDWSKTQAYALGLGGIYINKKGREREGIVEASDFQAVKQRVIDGLTGMKDGDQEAIRRVIDVQNDMAGPYREDGPDLIPGFHIGYRVSWDCAKGTISPEIFEDNTKSWSGDHDMDPELVPGVLFTNFDVANENPRLIDIGPTVLEMFGVDTPGHMIGRSITS